MRTTSSFFPINFHIHNVSIAFDLRSLDRFQISKKGTSLVALISVIDSNERKKQRISLHFDFIHNCYLFINKMLHHFINVGLPQPPNFTHWGWTNASKIKTLFSFFFINLFFCVFFSSFKLFFFVSHFLYLFIFCLFLFSKYIFINKMKIIY